MKEPDKPNFSLAIDPIILFIERIGIDIMAANTVWSIVLGVLPIEDSSKAKQMMEFSRRDTTEEKIKHITQLTEWAKHFTQRPDYSLENLTKFTYAIRQLSRYAFDDDKATSSLSELKDLYITFMTEYFYFSVKAGTKEEAINKLKSFGKEILKEDKELVERLFKIINYAPLN